MLGWLLVAHLLGVIVWAGTLLMLTRVMAWTATRPVGERGEVVALQSRLLFTAAVPGMFLTLATGVWMLVELDFGPLRSSVVGAGFHIKLTLVACLAIAHFVVQTKLQSLTYPDSPSARTIKALHGVVALLVVAVLVAVLVAYPTMARQKTLDNAKKHDRAGLVFGSDTAQPVRSDADAQDSRKAARPQRR